METNTKPPNRLRKGPYHFFFLRSLSSRLPRNWVALLRNGGMANRGTGDWLGVRLALEDRGINLAGKWIGTFYGVVGGGLKQRGAFDQRDWRTLPR